MIDLFQFCLSVFFFFAIYTNLDGLPPQTEIRNRSISAEREGQKKKIKINKKKGGGGVRKQKKKTKSSRDQKQKKPYLFPLWFHFSYFFRL